MARPPSLGALRPRNSALAVSRTRGGRARGHCRGLETARRAAGLRLSDSRKLLCLAGVWAPLFPREASASSAPSPAPPRLFDLRRLSSLCAVRCSTLVAQATPPV